MKTLEITDEQYEFIQKLRQQISADVVGEYGFVRERDAVQFLIDALDGDTDADLDLEFEVDGDFESAAGQDVAASVDAALTETDADDTITYDESEDTIESDGESGEDDGDDSDDESAEVTTAEESDESSDDGGADDAEDDSDDGDTDEDGDGDGDESDGAASDDDMLDQMMNLLDTHDDKWEESSSGDYRYAVELPDGGTEDAQTKDDVRAILFKNYR